MTQKDRVEILIVEDSPTQAEQLNYILEKNGYRTRVACNGKEALDLLGRYRPTVVVSDILMPEMDGCELCGRIKADERFKEMPVILLTALSGPEDVLRGLANGADNFITKPYEEEYLLDRIRRVVVNAGLRETARDWRDAEILFKGEKYLVTSGRQQILELLLSTYETAVMKNRKLKEAQEELESMNEQLRAEIAERRRREEEVRRLNEDLRCRALQLEEANRDLESFSYSVSHDLKSPLRAIDGFSCILLDEHAGELPEERRRLLKGIRKNAKKMGQLIDDILSFSRVGRKEIELGVVDTDNMARKIVEDLTPALSGRKVRFAVNELPPAMGDAAAVRQVFHNLITNAVKFTMPVDEALIEVGGRAVGDEIVYHVKDNGVGFDQDYADKLFGVFQRLHDNTEFEGTGIGLAIVKRIVNKLGGRVWAEGKAGGGAIFYFTLLAGAKISTLSPCESGRRGKYGGEKQTGE